ncbi:hypothetical protein M404DRAFT_26080 [Pisolithus tinctorius Marx 270]|uniref:NACHT domain-containing protein n=1 Tax=Pisolithus tinctorius Marx 270 TaxID=870435 RepID=A0A0C3PAJ9_PISTI|nr:hypothetical protein M404DRAFT_26080 [Pisolithus tinctorius Marx 270]
MDQDVVVSVPRNSWNDSQHTKPGIRAGASYNVLTASNFNASPHFLCMVTHSPYSFLVDAPRLHMEYTFSMGNDQLKKRLSRAANPSSFSYPPSVGRSFISVDGICRVNHLFAMTGKQSKKRRTSATNRSNFDPSSGPSQVTAGYLPSDTQASGSVSQWPMSAFPHPSESGYLASITGESAHVRFGRGAYEQREREQLRAAPTYETQRSAIEPIFSMGSTSNIDEDAIYLPRVASATFIETQSPPDTCLTPFKDFNQVVTTITEIHPYARMTLGMLAAISQMFVVQEIRDERVSHLLDTVRKVYEFLTKETTPKDMSGMRETLAKIALMTSGAVQFIKNYSATEDFWKRSGKDVEYETRDMSIAYIQALDDLMEQYRRHEDRGVQVDAFRVLGDLDLDGLARVRGTGPNWTKKCLDGTRTEILTEIINWIYATDENVPRILWLHGRAGKGKSAIAHTIALWFKNVGGVGCCFCFARGWQAEHLEEKIFRTIACDLAERDPAFRRALADALATDDSLKTTTDVATQWRKLILEPLCRISGQIVGNVVVVVDALDESGPERSRRHLLSVLASAQAADLPHNFRILVTSRPFPDIEHALNAARHVRVASLDDVPAVSEERDIRLYIMRRLGHLHGIGAAEVHGISQKAEGLFEWARLACEFVSPGRAIKNGSVKERFDNIMLLPSGGLLDAMYQAILKDTIPNDQISLMQFRSVMQQIISTLEPLHIDALRKMRSHFPANEDRYDMVAILESMALLFSGITDRSSPVRPLHASFYDFLIDPARSRTYFVGEPNRYNLAFASLRILSNDLHFNICGLESSYLSNSEVTDLEKRINQNISPHLSYSCRFWAQHLEKTAFDLALAELMKGVLGSEKLLFWLEALSLLGVLGNATDAVKCTVTWLLGHNDDVSSAAFAPDGKRIVSGSWDKTLRVWDAETGVQIGSPLEGHRDDVYSVAFSPDGKRIVSGSGDKTVRVWDAEKGVQIGSPLEGHHSWICSIAFSPDGKRIVAGSLDKTVRVWDAERGVKIGSPLEGHTESVNSVAFSPDGKRIVSGSGDKTVRVLDAERGVQIGSPLAGHTKSVNSVAFSPDGEKIVSGSGDKTVRVWDAEKGVQIGSPLEGHTDSVNSVAFSPDGKRIVSCSRDETLRVWGSAERGVQVGGPHEGHGVAAYLICFSSNPSHAIHDTAQLLDGLQYEGVDMRKEPIKLHSDGWVRGPKGRLLLWIPPTFWRQWYSMWTRVVIPRGSCIELDLSQTFHGNRWPECFKLPA